MNGIVRVLILAAALILVACETTPVEVDSDLQASTTDLGAASKNANGAIVLQWDRENHLWFTWNTDEQLISVHASKDHFYCPDGWEQEGGTASLLRIHRVYSPVTERVHISNQGELFTVVYQPANPEDLDFDNLWPSWCEFKETVSPIAEGMVHWTGLASNYYWNGQATDAWIFKIDGNLDDLRDGGKVHYSMKLVYITLASKERVSLTGPMLR